TLASGSSDTRVGLWDPVSNGSTFLPEHEGAVYGVGFSEDGNLLASVSGDGLVKVWDVSSRREALSLKRPEGEERAGAGREVKAVAFYSDRDGRLLVSGNPDGTLRWWPAPVFPQSRG